MRGDFVTLDAEMQAKIQWGDSLLAQVAFKIAMEEDKQLLMNYSKGEFHV